MRRCLRTSNTGRAAVDVDEIRSPRTADAQCLNMAAFLSSASRFHQDEKMSSREDAFEKVIGL